VVKADVILNPFPIFYVYSCNALMLLVA